MSERKEKQVRKVIKKKTEPNTVERPEEKEEVPGIFLSQVECALSLQILTDASVSSRGGADIVKRSVMNKIGIYAKASGFVKEETSPDSGQ